MTQSQAILDHLVNHGSLTPLDALNKFGCFRLAARINDLRRDGVDIDTVIVEDKDKHFAKYVLKRADAKC